MMRILSLTAVACVTLAASAAACDHCGRGGATLCCEVCELECCPCLMAEHTIMVPMRVMETQMKVKIIETMKEREETYTVFQRVPKTRKYTKECCYLECEVKSKEITKESCRRVDNPLRLVDSVNLPVPSVHEYTRKRVICTECGKVCIEEPCSCMVNRVEKVPRVQECEREQVLFEECKKTIDYCVQTPKFHTIDCGEETVYELVPVQKTRKVECCVPEAVKVPCEVCVTRMVAKRICCCEDCWCEMQRQAKREAEKAAKHDKCK